jgi:hypothetical protein
MRCPECDYELPINQADCPRCSFRRSLETMPSVQATAQEIKQEPEPVVMAAPTPFEPKLVAAPATNRRPFTALLGVAMPVAFLALALGSFMHHHKTPLTPVETKIHTIFVGADEPCRQGEQVPCMVSVNKIRALGDMPDGSLLLGDYRIANYVRTLPSGSQLATRWQHDQITSSELSAMGNDAYAHHLNVYKSLFMYMNVKNNHTDIPEYVIGGAKF